MIYILIMEINYEMIIKYLSPKDNNIFENKKNIMKFSSEFPDLIKDILGDKYYKFGVSQMIHNINYSFYTSILTILIDDYITLMENEEISLINKFFDELNEYININKKTYDDNFKKMLKNRETNILIMELIVKKFDINFLIFDFKSNEIFCVFPNDVMNPWKPFIFLAKHNNNWEPIRTQDKKLFNYNDAIIKKILLSNSSIEIKYYDNIVINKDYILLDNLPEIIENEFMSEDKSENSDNDKIEEDDEDIDIDETNKTFIKDEISINKFKKMKKEELIEYIESHNKKVPNKKAKKEDLIKMIIANICV
jgi:hypothetical protein